MSTILPFPSSPHCKPTTARFFFIAMAIGGLIAVAQVLVDSGGDLAFIHKSYDLFADLAAFEKEQRRNSAHVVFGGSRVVGIDVQLADLHASLKFAGDRVYE